MKEIEKVLLFCVIAIFLIVAGVSIIMLLDDTVSYAKEERLETTAPGMPSDLRYFDGKLYVRVDINEIFITGDDLGYFIDGVFYAPVGGFQTRWVVWEKERIEKQKEQEDNKVSVTEDNDDIDEEEDPDVEDENEDVEGEDEDDEGEHYWNKECPYCHNHTGIHCGCRYGTDYVI